MGKYIDHRLVAQPEPYNTFWDDSTANIESGIREGDIWVGTLMFVTFIAVDLVSLPLRWFRQTKEGIKDGTQDNFLGQHNAARC